MKTHQWWEPDDVILYHLGLGAGTGERDDLDYLYEGALRVLPTFAVVPGLKAAGDLSTVPGMDIDPVQALHVGQDLVVHRPLEARCEVTSESRVIDIQDKQKAALVVQEVVSQDAKGPLFTNRFTIYARGAGGFGGTSTSADPVLRPEGDPDIVLSVGTSPAQAALYRLSGDKNPLHIDPEVAMQAGFDRPILHGLCTYGIAAKVVIDALTDGDVDRLARFRTRFAGVVYPGETIVVSAWRTDDRIHLTAATRERDSVALADGLIDLRPDARPDDRMSNE